MSKTLWFYQSKDGTMHKDLTFDEAVLFSLREKIKNLPSFDLPDVEVLHLMNGAYRRGFLTGILVTILLSIIVWFFLH